MCICRNARGHPKCAAVANAALLTLLHNNAAVLDDDVAVLTQHTCRHLSSLPARLGEWLEWLKHAHSPQTHPTRTPQLTCVWVPSCLTVCCRKPQNILRTTSGDRKPGAVGGGSLSVTQFTCVAHSIT